MPPTKGEVWKHFLEIKNADSTLFCYACKFCSQKYTAPNPTRMRKNLSGKCKKCPENIKSSMNITGKA